MTDKRPVGCRFRLVDEGKPYPRSSCTICGKGVMTGLGRECSMITKHDPFITHYVETLGRQAAIIALQNYAAMYHSNAVIALNHKSFNHLSIASTYQQQSAWASRNARILMGIEE